MPVQSRMPVPAAAGEALGELASRAASLRAASGGNLLECFRGRAGSAGPARDPAFPLPCVLALCLAAVLVPEPDPNPGSEPEIPDKPQNP